MLNLSKAKPNILLAAIASFALIFISTMAVAGTKEGETKKYSKSSIVQVRDLYKIKIALDKYYKDNGAYPKSSGGFDVWDGFSTCWGKSTPDWIPGLVPKYIAKLPRDPRKSKDCEQHYLYQSNGTEYKLISHKPSSECFETAKKNYPELIDPHRPTWAFGFWTKNASEW